MTVIAKPIYSVPANEESLCCEPVLPRGLILEMFLPIDQGVTGTIRPASKQMDSRGCR